MKAWYPASKPGELRDTPWLHPSIVMYMEALIKPDWNILEHGSGGSTIWFAKRAKNVVSVEHNKEWMDFIQEQADKQGIDNLHLVFNESPVELQDNLPDGMGYDLLLIDGERTERIKWIDSAKYLVRHGGIVVLDNCNRPEYQDARTLLRLKSLHYITFDTNPPSHTQAVTEMYRMPGGNADENWI